MSGCRCLITAEQSNPDRSAVDREHYWLGRWNGCVSRGSEVVVGRPVKVRPPSTLGFRIVQSVICGQ